MNHERIERRVDRMLAEGLVEEVRELLADPRGLSQTARQALGYREIIDCLAADGALEDAVAQIKLKTRQFAKRQHTWFRNLEECRAVEITGSESPAGIVDRILDAARTSQSTRQP